MNLTEALLSESDAKLKNFSEKLIPTTKYEILGVKVPTVKNIARKAVKENVYGEFLTEKHFYYEEYLLHGFIICYIKEPFDKKTRRIKDFLPNIDNWGICDSVAAAFKDVKKNKKAALSFIYDLLSSTALYEKRFAVVLLLDYFTGEDFDRAGFEKVIALKGGEYYLDMAIAWYLSVLLIKNREETLGVFKNRTLDKFIHNKALQKAAESYRIDKTTKDYLKTLKIK